MSNFYVCVVYFSLPPFPESCTLIKNHDILPRDVLLCNRINDHHIRGGMQYDPNIENAEYAICEPRVRTSLQRKSTDYDNLYLLFRTRFFNHDGSSRYLVTGFYEVEKKFGETQSREAPIVHAKAMHFVSLADSIDITQKMEEEQAFRCCFTSNNDNWEQDLMSWVAQLSESEDQTTRYIEEINNLKKVFYENEVQDNGYSVCSACECSSHLHNCPLTWRRRHRSINPHPANYMTNLDEYYASIRPNERTPIT